MKKILSTLLIFFCASNVFSQYSYMPQLYSASGMNVKGKVKRITEKEVFTYEGGSVSVYDKERKEFVYEFDQNGNLIKTVITVDKYHPDTYYYNYLNGKLSAKSDQEGKLFFHYSPSSVTLKDSIGTIKQIHSLSNDRVSESNYYYDFEKNLSIKIKYDYNKMGQVEKTAVTSLGTSLTTYEYNKQGDRIKNQSNNFLGPLITVYDYQYDKKKNWTKCMEESYKPGANKDDRTYIKRTRVYEFF